MTDQTILALGSITVAGMTMAIGAIGAAFGESRIAAAAMDAGEPVTLLSSEAKLYASEAAVHCAERGVQIHGGYGFIKDYRAEKFYRDAKICTIGEGTSEIQRMVIARQLLKG